MEGTKEDHKISGCFTCDHCEENWESDYKCNKCSDKWIEYNEDFSGDVCKNCCNCQFNIKT